ncbi:hypothetical protein EYM_06750 [Ignicoccus islandicus DSM 13165]|uniref:Small multi-drug export protein n=1 Tax=Ignicoccus islandicus DSM 13165 TaxID=940295 RepID=A0A0U2MBN2_9CREN|nr:small multi-drug export protein [Ignicoccus islandicus]ALU12717.1 hypothetical protein EYM_06750 [Ignicoccus islandicus DSM 13165]
MDCLYASIISVLPVVEVRGSIPLLVSSRCPSLYILISYALSTLTGIAVYVLIEHILNMAMIILARTWKGGRKILDKIIERTERNASEKVERYGTIGLILFIGIPLPGTGVWTGALAGYLLGLKQKDVILAIAVGNAIATAIVFLASNGALLVLR